MIKCRFLLPVMGLLGGLALNGCLPKATPSPDTMATAVAEAAFRLLTQTAAASSPTPRPPTPTMTPSYTDTPTAEPTSTVQFRYPMTVNFASCGLGGPEPQFAHETSVKKGKGVELLGIGSIDGYLVIRDPYFHRPCWMKVTDLKIFDGTDMSQYPVMTPGVPPQGQ